MGKKMIDRIPRDVLLKKMVSLHDSGMAYAEISKELGLTTGYVGQSIRNAKMPYNAKWLDERSELEGLQTQTHRCLRSAGIHTKANLLAAIHRGDVHAKNKWPGFGQKCVEDIQKFARENFGEDVANSLDVKKKPTPKDAALQIQAIPYWGNEELFRCQCLEFMCNLLRDLGYGDVVDFFEKETVDHSL